MSGWTKLFSSIVTSSIWCEDDATVRVWVAMLATADADGVVEGSIPGFANMARVPVEAMRAAVVKLSSPDPDSRTPDHEGRRIESIEGGWRLLNYTAYRERGQAKEGSKAPAMRKYRERKRSEKRVVTQGNALPPEVTGDPEERGEKRERTNGLSPLRGQVADVFKHWQSVMEHPDSRLTDERRRKVEARLKEGSTVDQIKAAIDGCRASAFHMGENDSGKRHDDLTLICRSGSKLDWFRQNAPAAGNGRVETRPMPPPPTEEQMEASRRAFEEFKGKLGASK